jgi:hypothetical protein
MEATLEEVDKHSKSVYDVLAGKLKEVGERMACSMLNVFKTHLVVAK